MKEKTVIYAFLLIVSIVSTACGPREPLIEVTDVWGRPSPNSSANAAFYLTIQNKGREADKLVAAEAAHCDMTMLHESVIDENDVMHMEHVEEIVIPPGDTIQLEIGGLHIMCLSRQIDHVPDLQVPITLTFATSGDIQVQAVIMEQ